MEAEVIRDSPNLITQQEGRTHSPHGPPALHRRLKGDPAFSASTTGIRNPCSTVTISSSGASPARNFPRLTKARHWFCFTCSPANSLVSATGAVVGSGVLLLAKVARIASDNTSPSKSHEPASAHRS
jgi:hypothetical protein